MTDFGQIDVIHNFNILIESEKNNTHTSLTKSTPYIMHPIPTKLTNPPPPPLPQR